MIKKLLVILILLILAGFSLWAMVGVHGWETLFAGLFVTFLYISSFLALTYKE